MQGRQKPTGERPHEAAGPRGKRRYVTPTLTEYGSIGKLTQGASGVNPETGGGMMAMCL